MNGNYYKDSEGTKKTLTFILVIGQFAAGFTSKDPRKGENRGDRSSDIDQIWGESGMRCFGELHRGE